MTSVLDAVEAETLRYVRRVERQFGVHLEVKFAAASLGAPFSMRWGEVYLDRDELGKQEHNERLREVGHEFGHRLWSPGTAAEKILWEAIATQEGIEQPADFCNISCIEKGAVVHGLVQEIDNIKVGDKVLGNDGESEVTGTFSRPYSGEIIAITPSNLPTTRFTPEHPILVTSYRRVHYTRTNEWVRGTAEWKPASSVRAGDYLVVPRKKRSNTQPVLSIRTGKKGLGMLKSTGWKGLDPRAWTDRRPYNTIIVNRDIAFLLGLYTAEGSLGRDSAALSNRYRIVLNLGSHEIELAAKAKSSLESMGIRSSTHQRGSALFVVANNKDLNNWLRREIGDSSQSKRIPSSIKEAPAEILWSFLDGLWAGDGSLAVHKRTHAHTRIVVTTSKLLAHNVLECLFSLGQAAWLSHRKREKIAYINGRPIHQHDIWAIGYSVTKSKERTKQRIKFEPDYCYLRVRKVESQDGMMDVYNLKTTSGTYAIPFVVHNCDSIIERSNTVGHSLGVCPWAEKYSLGLESTLKKHSEGLPPPVQFLHELDLMSLAEYRGEKYKEEPSELATKCFQVLFRKDLLRPEMIRELAKLTGHLFKKPLDYSQSWNQGSSSDGEGEEAGSDNGEGGEEDGDGGSKESGKDGKEGGAKKSGKAPKRGKGGLFVKPLPTDGEVSRKEASEVAAALARLYGTEGITEETKAFLKSREKRISRILTAWSAYTKVMPIVRKFAGKHETPLEVAARKWNVGMPLKKLDLKATVSKYGVIVPGMTTLARAEVRRTVTSTGMGTLCLLPDYSLSMVGEKVERVVEAALGLVETARHFNDKFSLVSIGDGYSNLVLDPSYDYSRAFNALMDFEGYCDCLTAKMLATALSFAERSGKQLTMILSDNLPPDDFCNNTELVERLAKFGPVIFVVFTPGYWNQTQKALSGKDNVMAVLVEDPTKEFTWQALEPVWKAASEGKMVREVVS